MPTFFNFNKRKGVFMIPAGATKSPTPAPPSFSNTKSLAFDGVDEYVDCGNISALNGVTEATWMGWFKRGGAGSFYIMSTYGAGQIQFFVLQANSNVTAYAATSTGAQRTMAKANITWSVGQWYHLAFVYNEAEVLDSDKMKIYIDGVLQTNVVAGASLTSLNSSTAPFNIGRLGGATTNEFNGNIDEVAIFTSALTSEQISTIATAPSDLTSLNPTVWYRNGDNSTYQTPQILMPEESNKNKVSNYSLSFDGVGDYITFNSPSSLWTAGSLSVSFWLKTTTTQNDSIITMDDYSAGNRNWQIEHRSSGNVVRFLIISGFSSFFVNTSVSINDGNWHHIVCTYEPSTALKVYIDGSLDNSNTTSIPASRNTDSANLRIATNDFGSNYTGNIDEVAIFDTTLSASDVTSIYNGGEPTTISGATAYWKLGEQAKFTDNWLVPNSALSNYSKFSFNLDGVDDYIDIGNGISFNYNNPFTISTWLNVNAVSGFKAIYNKYDSSISGGRGIALNLYSSFSSGINLVYFDIYSTNSGSTSTRKRITTTTAPIVNYDIWYLLTVTYDGSGLGSGIKIYLNGVSQAVTVTQDNLQSGDITNSLNANIGATTTPSNFFNGNIDETAIYDTALNSTQVSELYNSGEPTTIPSGAVAHWRMGEEATYNSSTSQWTIPDQVGSNDGTSNNTMALNTLVGEAPNYFGGGVSNAMTIEDRVGEAPNSSNNAVSFNMEAEDIDNNTP